MDLSAPSILPPRVRVPSTPSMLFSIYIVQIVYLSYELQCEMNENKEKEAGIGPFLEKCSVYLYLIHRPFYLKTPLAIRGDGFSGTGAALESERF